MISRRHRGSNFLYKAIPYLYYDIAKDFIFKNPAFLSAPAHQKTLSNNP